MTISTVVRRGLVPTLLAVLFSAPAIPAAATSVSADWRCTGEFRNSSTSATYVGYRYLNNDVFHSLAPGESDWGTAANPITKMFVPVNNPSKIAYYNLIGGAYITTHYPDRGGWFDKNPCHYAVVTVYRP